MTTQRILLLSYLILGVLLALVLEHLLSGSLGGIGALSFLNRTVFDTERLWSKVGGFVLAGGIAAYCWRDPRVKAPATQVVEEMQRVTWPTLAETRAATYAVIIATLVCAAMLGLFDYGWGALTERIYTPR